MKSTNKLNDLIFILGPGRSGTSLLQSMLDSNSKIKFLKENQYLRQVLYGKKDVSWFLENKQERIENLEDLIKYKHLSKAMFYNEMVSTHYTGSISFVGDKDPRLIDYVDRLIQDFRHSKIVFMIRDPRDIILSRIKAKWSSKWPFFFQVLLVYAQLKKFNGFIKKNSSSLSIHTVMYENLLSQPEKSLVDLCGFLDIEFEKEMLDYKKSSKRLVSKSEIEWKEKTFKEIDKSNFNKWKTEFNLTQIHLLNNVFREIIDQYDYEFIDVNDLKKNKKFKNHIEILLIKILSKLYNLRLL